MKKLNILLQVLSLMILLARTASATHIPESDEPLMYDGSLVPGLATTGSVGWSSPLDGYDWYCFQALDGSQLTVTAQRTSGDIRPNIGLLQGIGADGEPWTVLPLLTNTRNSSQASATLSFNPGFSGPVTIWVSTWLFENGGDYEVITTGGNALAACNPPLDHFLGYKIKDSQGNICSAESLQNVGAVCESEGECGGTEDETTFCVPKGFPKGVRVSLTDQFETGLFDVQKPVSLYNPADKNGEGISDPNTHLKAYQIRQVSKVCGVGAPQNVGAVCQREEDCGGVTGQDTFCQRTPPHVRRTNIRVENQFHPSRGELRVDTIKPSRLLVPTAKSRTAPVNPPDPASHDVDHFKCYSVKVSRGVPRFAPILEVSVGDQFQQPKMYDLKKPTRLCTPVNKEGEGIKNEAAHLLCYQAALTRTDPRQAKHEKVKGIFVNNQFGPELVDTVKEDELCVPSTKILP